MHNCLANFFNNTLNIIQIDCDSNSRFTDIYQI